LSTLRIRKPTYKEDPRWGFFANGSGSFGDQETTPSQSGYNYTTAGATVGADYRLTDHLALGLASGYSDTDSNLTGSGGKVDATMVTLQPYLSYFTDNFYLNASVSAGFNGYDTERKILFGTVDRTARGETDGREVSAFIGGGYDFKAGSLSVGPTFSAQYTKLWIDRFSETGANSLDLTVDDQTAESVQTTIGGRLAYKMKFGGFAVTPEINAAYEHEFSNNSRGIKAQLAQGSNAFQTQTSNPRRDAIVAGGSIGLNLTENLTFNLSYSQEFGHSDYIEQTINGTLRLVF